MPIVKYQNQEVRFPKCGTLRKGAPKPERGPGRDLNYFRFDPIDEQTGKDFAEHYGDEPRSINVFLPYATTDENFHCWQEEYSASELKHRCDGEFVYERNARTGQIERTDTPCPGGCQEVGRLTVIIPELKRFAYVTVLTGSAHDLAELLSNLQAIEMLQRDLRGIPMVLRRIKRMISTPDDRTGKRARREKWLLNIEVAPQWARSMLTSMERQAMPLLETTVNDRPALVDTRSGEILEVEHTIEEPQAEPEQPGASFNPNTPQPSGRPTGAKITNRAAAVKALIAARERCERLAESRVIDLAGCDEETSEKYDRAFTLNVKEATPEQIQGAANWLTKFANVNEQQAQDAATVEA
jgi:hypothetical protein